MNSPGIYSICESGSSLDASFVSPLHGLNRTCFQQDKIVEGTLMNFISPLKNKEVLQILDRYYLLAKHINKEGRMDETTPKKRVMSNARLSMSAQASPKSAKRRRRQSLMVIEALDSISTVSKTPTQVKIRHSSVFLDSAVKMRGEQSAVGSCDDSQAVEDTAFQAIKPEQVFDDELLQLLQQYMHTNGSNVNLLKQSCEPTALDLEPYSADDWAPSLPSSRSSSARKSKQSQENIFKSATAKCGDKLEETVTSTPLKAISPQQNLCSEVSKRRESLSSRRLSNLGNVMDSCTKALQEVDVALRQ